MSSGKPFFASTYPVDLNPDSVEAMAEVGIQIAQHCSKSLAKFRGEPFDQINIVRNRAKDSCHVWLGARHRVHWGFDDPAAETDPIQRRQIFRRVCEEIDTSSSLRKRSRSWGISYAVTAPPQEEPA